MSLFWQLLQKVGSRWTWPGSSNRSCRPRARWGSTEAWLPTSSKSSPPSASATWCTSSWRRSWEWPRAESQSHDFQRLHFTRGPAITAPPKVKAKRIPGDVGTPPGVPGVISFCECQLRKDKKGCWMSGKMKLEDMDSVSSGCGGRDCCYLCLRNRKGAFECQNVGSWSEKWGPRVVVLGCAVWEFFLSD